MPEEVTPPKAEAGITCGQKPEAEAEDKALLDKCVPAGQHHRAFEHLSQW